MLILCAPTYGKDHHYDLPPQELREYHALKASAIDIERFPILGTHWTGPMLYGGRLVVNDNSPLANRYLTEPFPVGDR